MATKKMIFSGFGGQGVISMGTILCYGAMSENLQATFLPSYGPEMRGGTANCHVCISDKEIASPLISTPDILIAMNRPSLAKFESKVKPGGIIIVNTDVCTDKVQRTDVKAYYVSVLAKAIELGNPKVQNTIMLGAIQKACAILSDEHCLNGLDYLLGSKPQLLELNHKAYFVGKELL